MQEVAFVVEFYAKWNAEGLTTCLISRIRPGCSSASAVVSFFRAKTGEDAVQLVYHDSLETCAIVAVSVWGEAKDLGNRWWGRCGGVFGNGSPVLGRMAPFDRSTRVASLVFTMVVIAFVPFALLGLWSIGMIDGGPVYLMAKKWAGEMPCERSDDNNVLTFRKPW